VSRIIDMKAIIAYITQYDPAYSSTIRGASAAQIQRLTDLVGRELPNVYRSFLELMGMGMGRLHVQHSDFTVETVLHFYEDRLWRPPENFIYIAEDGTPENRDYFLDCAVAPGASPSVVRFSSYGDFDPGGIEFCYESLGDMLLSHAFINIRMPLLAYNRRYNTATTHAQPLHTLHRIMLDLGFQEVMNTCQWSTRYEHAEAAVRAYHHPQQPRAYLQIATAEEAALKRLQAILDDHIGLESLGPASPAPSR
jgi:hypothetical protein